MKIEYLGGNFGGHLGLTLVAILNLKVKMGSNYKTDFKSEFLDPKNHEKHMLIRSIGQTSENLIFKMADGSHIGFEGQNEVK